MSIDVNPDLNVVYNHFIRSDSLKTKFRLASWNLERCKDIASAATIIRDQRIDICCLSEMDWGLARSGNVNTSFALAETLDQNCLFAIEYIELGHGNQTEITAFQNLKNTRGLHGNAILSPAGFLEFSVVRLTHNNEWNGLDWHSERIGSRIAVVALFQLVNTQVVVVNTHLECLCRPDFRSSQMTEILNFINQRYRKFPVVIAGDMNTSALPSGSEYPSSSPDWLRTPYQYEPMFKVLLEEGYDWLASNNSQHTRRMLANGWPQPPFKKLDWIFTRGLKATAPNCIAAVRTDGSPVSDHEMIVVDLSLP